MHLVLRKTSEEVGRGKQNQKTEQIHWDTVNEVSWYLSQWLHCQIKTTGNGIVCHNMWWFFTLKCKNKQNTQFWFFLFVRLSYFRSHYYIKTSFNIFSTKRQARLKPKPAFTRVGFSRVSRGFIHGGEVRRVCVSTKNCVHPMTTALRFSGQRCSRRCTPRTESRPRPSPVRTLPPLWYCSMRHSVNMRPVTGLMEAIINPGFEIHSDA